MPRPTASANAHRFAAAAPDEDLVYGACAPGWHTAADHGDALADWTAFMKRKGVSRVCCLVSGCQPDPSGEEVCRYRQAFGRDRVLHAPTPDNQLVDEALLATEVLPFIDDAVDAEERVVVHCLAGISRTGQVLAAWLAYDRDYGPERAIETVEGMGRTPTEAVQSGTATEEQLHDLLSTFV